MAFTGIAAVATGLAAAVVLPLIQPSEPEAAGSPSDTKTFTTTGSVAASTSSTTPAYDRPTVDSKAASTEADPMPASDVQPTAGAVSPQVPAAGTNGVSNEPAAVPTSDAPRATGTPGTASAPATGSTRDQAAAGAAQAPTATPTAAPEPTGTASTASSASESPRPTASATPTERAVPSPTAPAQRSARATAPVSPKPAPSTETSAPGGPPVPGVSLEIGTDKGEAALRKLRAVRGGTVDDPNWRWIRSHLDGREEEDSR
ncbi:hypothetical protein AHIS1636_32630 [Arthrobacter mangrovi]|uniref:Uncharacterized protein n=1 Tax=Arthrobacter mangrovi TaxID=2966350 RepID=A0ABQ5MY08_9MICC|nr:hypothetical protein AHIS1636_32630 [Arthrobacter mangrovi]